MKTISRLLAIVAMCTLIGCGGSADKNKNKDKDVPKPAEAAGK